MLSASFWRISRHQKVAAFPAAVAHAHSRNPLPRASCSSRDVPRSVLSPPLRAPVPHPCKSLSSEIRWPAAPSLFRFARNPQSRASCPTRPLPRVDPSPILSSSRSAPAPLLPPDAWLPPSSASTQSPPLFHPERQAYSSPPHRAWCTPPRRYYRTRPPHSLQSAISAQR